MPARKQERFINDEEIQHLYFVSECINKLEFEETIIRLMIGVVS